MITFISAFRVRSIGPHGPELALYQVQRAFASANVIKKGAHLWVTTPDFQYFSLFDSNNKRELFSLLFRREEFFKRHKNGSSKGKD